MTTTVLSPSPFAVETAPRCIKCAGRLRPYHRTGLVIEQCEDCRGIYLDGGELERLIDAEGGGWSGRIGPPWPAVANTCDGEPIAAGQPAWASARRSG